MSRLEPNIGEEFALELVNVTKTYPGITALKNVSLRVKKGTIHGFLGPNGAGKTTTMKVLSGLIVPNSGEVFVKGSLGYLPDTPPLYTHMRVREFLDFVYDIEGLDKNTQGFKDEKNLAIEKVLNKTGLNEVQNRIISNLSKGYQQRVGIAETLVHSPEVIILDEPTVGLDPVAINEIRSLIRDLKNDHTILFSSHLLNEVELLSDEISMISDGEILYSGAIAEIKKRFQGVFQIHLKIKRWDASLKESLTTQAKLDDLKISEMKGWTELTCFSSIDPREEIASFVVENKCGLLEMKQIEIDLTDIFKRLINAG